MTRKEAEREKRFRRFMESHRDFAEFFDPRVEDFWTMLSRLSAESWKEYRRQFASVEKARRMEISSKMAENGRKGGLETQRKKRLDLSGSLPSKQMRAKVKPSEAKVKQK